MIAALQVFLQTSSQLYAPTPAPNLIHLLFKAFGVFRFPLPCSATLTPFPATHPQNSPVTPFAATHTNSPSCKSFPCHTYKKQGVSPFWECGGLAAAFTAANLAPHSAMSSKSATTSPLFFFLH